MPERKGEQKILKAMNQPERRRQAGQWSGEEMERQEGN